MPPATRKPRPQDQEEGPTVLEKFQKWLTLRDQGEVVTAEVGKLKEELKAFVMAEGEEDDKGSFWLTLAQKLPFTSHKGKTTSFGGLKAEKHMKPAVPFVDPNEAEKVLRKKGLWLTEKQEKLLAQLQMAAPNVNITVDCDTDSFEALYFQKKITTKEYESCLVEQKEEFHFVLVEG